MLWYKLGAAGVGKATGSGCRRVVVGLPMIISPSAVSARHGFRQNSGL